MHMCLLPSGGGGKPAAVPPDSRQALVSRQQEADNLRARVAHLKQMAVRQAKDKVMAPQIARKLEAARAALAAAEGHHHSALAKIQAVERQKKWTKF